MTNTQTTTTDTPCKLEAFRRWIGIHHTTEPVALEDITEHRHDPDALEYDGAELLILTEEEANERAADYIRETLWAFNANFLWKYMPEGLAADDIEALRGDRCESVNDAFLALVGDNFDRLVEDAIAADGRGHFLNSWDGEEYDLEDESGRVVFFGYKL